MRDEVGAALGARGGDDELALDPVERAPSWHKPALDNVIGCPATPGTHSA
jgi:hypothetical protein